MLDLFAIAKGNINSLEQTFAKITGEASASDAALIREFATWVEAQSLISINVKLYVVGELLSGRAHLNTYESAQELSSITGIDGEDLLRQILRGYYEKRTTFDRSFSNGEKFRYGALYLGGAGLTEYAPYCLVLSRAFQDSLAEIACLPGDSLWICFSDTESFDEDSVRRLAAPYSHRHLLVAIERAKEIPPLERGRWLILVAGANRYFEVVFVGEVSLKTVEFVSVLKSDYDRMLTLLFDSFGKKLDEAGRANAQDFRVLIRGVKEGKLRLEVVT